MSSCGSSLFGPPSQYIKVLGGDFVAVQGSNIMEKLTVSDLRMPYKQILKSRVILKPGQTNYLLNHLGLGDNATFLAIKVLYDPKSVIEEDNFINWSFYDDMSNIHTMAQMMVLTGNSTNRIKQLYLTNPSVKYPVSIEVMIGVIDDNYSFFSDTINQIGTSFTGLEYTDIKSYVVGESIVINDKYITPRPLIYINIVNIQSIERNSNLLIIDDSGFGTIFLQFIDEYNAIQAQSLLNYVIDNVDINIDNLTPGDNISPIIYFNSYFDNISSNAYISYNGLTSSVPYNTTNGFTFSTSIDYSTYVSASPSVTIDKEYLINSLISGISDNRDGTMSIIPSNILLTYNSSPVNLISGTGSYLVKFKFEDIANNDLDSVNITINVN